MFVQTPLCLLVLCLWSAIAVAQQTEAEYLLDASIPVDTDRYKDIRGNPYRYDGFLPGTIYDNTLNAYEIDSLNFNGHRSEFEYYVDGELRSLNNLNFLRVEIVTEDGTQHDYGWNIVQAFPNAYAEILFAGDFITGLVVYEVINDEKVVQDVGKTLRLQRFSPKTHHYAVVDGELVSLSSKAKRLAGELGFPKQIQQRIKQQNLKPTRREELIEILAYAEELYAEN
ncbi:MAG: hypothetical protein WA952_04420 [Lewinella sp.]